jgi:hypothetical protein
MSEKIPCPGSPFVKANLERNDHSPLGIRPIIKRLRLGAPAGTDTSRLSLLLQRREIHASIANLCYHSGPLAAGPNLIPIP